MVEYINESFKRFVETCGIEHQISAPYNPEQNDKSERDIQTFNEMIRSMIYGRKCLSSKMPMIKGCQYGCIHSNRSTSKNDKSPFERWTNKKPDLLDQSLWICYMHVPSHQRQKLDHKAKMIFVDYQGKSNNCRLFDPKTRKITVAASVIFNEEEIYYDLQKTEKLKRTYEYLFV